VRRQTLASGINPAGSSRALRLDPLSLPVSFAAHDIRADGGVRQVELHRERVILRRAVHGMRMAVNVRVSDFLGVAMRETGDGQMLVLVHRDPSLSIPLCVSTDSDEIASAWQMWSDIFSLPQLHDTSREPAPRRRRRNAIRARRPKFLVRRQMGGLLNAAGNYRGEREIIARD
jgi:stringent starvation protein B